MLRADAEAQFNRFRIERLPGHSARVERLLRGLAELEEACVFDEPFTAFLLECAPPFVRLLRELHPMLLGV